MSLQLLGKPDCIFSGDLSKVQNEYFSIFIPSSNNAQGGLSRLRCRSTLIKSQLLILIYWKWNDFCQFQPRFIIDCRARRSLGLIRTP